MENIDKNVKFLGLNSFFTDISTEMILPLLPIFLDKFLHASKTDIGFMEGLAELSAALLIAAFGFYSDRIGRRKSIALFGYTLSNLTKPLMVFANSFSYVVFIRVVDRVGKGIRTAPRDALIASYTDKNSSGKSFGFHKMMDSGGALIGSLVAFFILYNYSDNETAFKIVFAVSLIPGVLAFLTLALFVKDNNSDLNNSNSRFFDNIRLLDSKFYSFVVFQALFAAIAMNYSFFILKIEHDGISIAMIPIIYAVYNLAQSAPALKIGSLSDKYGKKTMLLFAYGSFCVGVAFFISSIPYSAWFGFTFFGLFVANFNSMSKAIIADMVPSSIKASAYGIYFCSIGVASFCSLYFAGVIWDRFGVDFLFNGILIAGSVLSAFAFIGLIKTAKE